MAERRYAGMQDVFMDGVTSIFAYVTVSGVLRYQQGKSVWSGVKRQFNLFVEDAAAEKQQVEAEVVMSKEPLPMIEGDGRAADSPVEPAPQPGAATVEAEADSSKETGTNSSAALEGAEEKPVTAEITEGDLERENERLRAEIEALTTTRPQPESSHLKLAGRHSWRSRRSKRSKAKRSTSTAEEPPESEAATFEVEALKFSEEKSSKAKVSSSTSEGAATAEAEAIVSDEPLPFVDGDEREDNSTVQEPAPQPEANSTVQEPASQPEAATEEEREAEEERLAKEEFERQAEAEHKVEVEPEVTLSGI